MKLRRSLLALAATVLVASPAPPTARATAVPTLAPGDLRPGQKAVVHTVFTGDKVEEFAAEIVGVLMGGRTEGDLILARATDERVIKSGIAAGMSGSPVYVDGRLVGALSSGWTFSREPMFGVTPIGEMLQVLELPTPSTSEGTAGPIGIDPGARGTGLRFGEFRWAEADSTMESAAPTPRGLAAAGLRALPVPLSCGGLNPEAMTLTREMFAPLGLAVVPGGKASGAGPAAEAFQPGAAVAVDILRGDLLLSAIGTVTYRDGDRVLIFGHPLFQAGDVRLPMSTASIVTIVASDLSSFKLGSTGRPVGVLTQDRRSAMAGRIGGYPRLMPMRVDVQGGPRGLQTFRFQSIQDRALAPQVIAIAALNSLMESGGVGANQTLRWTMRVRRAAAPALVLSDVVVGESPTTDLVAALASPLRFLYNNPYGRLTLDSIAVSVTVEGGRDQWVLRGAELLQSAVRPGGTLRVRCDLERWRGEHRIVTLALRVPEEAPDGRYLLWVGGGPDLSRYEAARLPGRYRPVSLEDAWQRLAAFRPADQLYASLFARASEITRDGRDYPDLPASVMAVLSGSSSAVSPAARGDRLSLDEVREPIAGQLRGELQLEITVDAKAP